MTSKPDSALRRLHARLAETVRQKALADFRAGNPARRPPSLLLAQAVSLAVLTLPWLIGLGGVVIVVAGYPYPGRMILGGLLAFVGWMIRPRMARLPGGLISPSDAPKLFALLGEVATQMKSPVPDAVILDADFNASIGPYTRKKKLILQLGVPLWKALDPQERLAVLAHELAHTVNNDPARSGVIHRALEVLERWYDLWSPPLMIDGDTGTAYASDDHGFLSRTIRFLAQMIISALIFTLTRLLYLESQRAEYLADALSARVAGSEAAMSAQRKLALYPLAWKALNGTYVTPNSKSDLLGVMSAAIRTAEPRERDRLFAEAEAEGVAIDGTHPPTRQRLKFLSELALPESGLRISQATGDAIDRELAPHFDRVEGQLRRQLAHQ